MCLLIKCFKFVEFEKKKTLKIISYLLYLQAKFKHLTRASRVCVRNSLHIFVHAAVDAKL